MYDYFFTKCVFRWSEKSVGFENLMEIGFRRAKFCEILSLSVKYGMYDCVVILIESLSVCEPQQDTKVPFLVWSENPCPAEPPSYIVYFFKFILVEIFHNFFLFKIFT